MYFSCDIRQHELTQKCVKLKVLEDLMKSNELKIKKKKKVLKVEHSELDKLHERVWSLESKMCDEIWDFSRKHDFDTVVNNYPDVPWDFSFDCDCEGPRAEKPVETVEDRTETRLLLLEIEDLKAELEAQRSCGLKEDMIRLKRELREAEDGTPEMQKLRKEIDECEERIVNLKELNRAKYSYNYDFFNDHMLPEDNNASRLSPASTTCSERIKSCISKTPEAGPKSNSKFKRRSPQPKAKTSTTGSHFVKASDFMSDIENHTELDNPYQLHFASGSTTAVTTNEANKKKFVFKEKSTITRKQKR
ncbi:hypothetical protein TSAR_009429 [Trichomalopsis sarcophagae]|uniref:Uncharacterized protein n=1 Tax=Trichomalopsis sarcophagae TaxID=543379 RepID=A0A232FLG4_9HYME|nr:hypothetical protein TSAR_009429 [Trichomalopsis sarcophagae]